MVSSAQYFDVKLQSRKWQAWFLATSQCQQSSNQTLRVWCDHYSIDKKLLV